MQSFLKLRRKFSNFYEIIKLSLHKFSGRYKEYEHPYNQRRQLQRQRHTCFGRYYETIRQHSCNCPVSGAVRYVYGRFSQRGKDKIHGVVFHDPSGQERKRMHTALGSPGCHPGKLRQVRTQFRMVGMDSGRGGLRHKPRSQYCHCILLFRNTWSCGGGCNQPYTRNWSFSLLPRCRFGFLGSGKIFPFNFRKVARSPEA